MSASSSQHPFIYDAFISYRQREPDLTWVRKTLHSALEFAGLKVAIDYRDFQLGAPVISEIERAIQASRYTVAILSPAYLESNFTRAENLMAEHLGLEESQRRLIAIMREQCSPRLGIRYRLWFDMTNDAEFETNLARLVAQLKQPHDE